MGRMFRPDAEPLFPNWRHLPVAYHGRSGTVVPSGTPVRRPCGQRPGPEFGPSARLDIELEAGFVVGVPSALGEPVPVERALDHVFGMVLVNDWSARDIQAWEYQPLGPFLAKNFATTVSPWVVTLDALAPYRTPSYARPDGDPEPLPYLDDAGDRAAGGFGLTLEVRLRTKAMRERGDDGAVVSRGSFADMYWTLAQMLTHHASNGCNLRPGDLIASGTVSGPAKDSRGCMLELTWRGAEPLALPGGETRRFLEDGDEVVMRGWCEREGRRRIGFGECRGTVVPARP
jgi:fumarylacetoacetase